MLSTMLMDAYEEKEKNHVAEAIDELCFPDDLYGWASSGIYIFWNYSTKEILYIGLAIDLANRFRQHNGLLGTSSEGNKREYIQKYFENNTKLGYSILVQSANRQQKVSRNNNFPQKGNKIDGEADEIIKNFETILLEKFKELNGSYPEWNKISGNRQALNMNRNTAENYLYVATHPECYEIAPILSRYSIRELSINVSAAEMEIKLTGIRLNAMLNGNYQEYMDFIENTEYKYKKLVL